MMNLAECSSLLAQRETMYPTSERHSADAPYWFAESASAFAPGVDFVFWVIFWVSAVFFLIIVGVMCYFVVKYRRRPGVKSQPSASHNTPLEIFWSVIPSILLVWFFYEGAKGFFEMRVAPDSAEEIHVVAKKWNWFFIYPNGDTSPELHLVMDRPVKLILESEDVLHSLFISAFRQKMDVVPGRYTYLYLLPTKRGTWRLSCTEYCGDNHSDMVTWCHVHLSESERNAQTKWDPMAKKPWETGQRLYMMHCAGCHKVDGQRNVGPALNDIWEKDETVFNGQGQRKTIRVDENYIRESLLNPNVWIVEGFEYPTKMQIFEGKLSDTDIRYLIAYIKYLKDPAKFDLGHEDPAAENGANGEAVEGAAGAAEKAADDKSNGSGEQQQQTEDASGAKSGDGSDSLSNQ